MHQNRLLITKIRHILHNLFSTRIFNRGLKALVALPLEHRDERVGAVGVELGYFVAFEAVLGPVLGGQGHVG